mmetsp:Transcript_103141/g.297010  ORF Transcript_103141/g.297010 Transcript_103141/m.297010 type:complete len:322 (+) Transcript_103141:84-1049(+)
MSTKQSEVCSDSTAAVSEQGSMSSGTVSPVCEKAQEHMSLEALHDWRPKENAFGDSFRNYEDSKRQDIVAQTYLTMHTRQTVEFGKRVRERWLKFDKGEFTILEMIAMLDELVDDSDPDNELPNSIHDFQTAERIRQQWPEHDWFHLVGLLHDVGKVLALPQVAGEDALPQWAVVGDTFPVGCAPAEECVFGRKSFEANPDLADDVYRSENGMYEPGCGISKLMMSWGHDEYMYWVLKENGCTIPEAGLDMIRFHSFYPWHDRGAYAHLEAPEDEERKKWVKEFNKFDLYSKGDEVPDVAALKPYYQGLLEKYGIGGKLRW